VGLRMMDEWQGRSKWHRMRRRSLLLLEDLHWSHHSTLELIAVLPNGTRDDIWPVEMLPETVAARAQAGTGAARPQPPRAETAQRDRGGSLSRLALDSDVSPSAALHRRSITFVSGAPCWRSKKQHEPWQTKKSW
jgi:hypothetical protein